MGHWPMCKNEGQYRETKLDIRFSNWEVRTSWLAFIFREYNFYIVVQWIVFKYLHNIEPVTPILLEKQEKLEKIIFLV